MCTTTSIREITSDGLFEALSEAEKSSEHGGIKGSCDSCPFNAGMTEAAEQAQNFVCVLPTAIEIATLATQGKNWACHSNTSKVCGGLCGVAKSLKLNLSANQLHHDSGVHGSGQSV